MVIIWSWSGAIWINPMDRSECRFFEDMKPEEKQHPNRSNSQDHSLIQSVSSPHRFAPNSLWQRCLLGYLRSRPEIGLSGLRFGDKRNQCSHHEPEQPEQPEGERLHRFPESWFLTTWAEMIVMRVMATKASVSKILPPLSIANCRFLLKGHRS